MRNHGDWSSNVTSPSPGSWGGDCDEGTSKLSAKRLAKFAQFSFVGLRANIARKLTGLAHREFCVRLADSPLLQWFLQVGQIDQVKVFSKSTSHRFDAWLKPESLCQINDRLIALPSARREETPLNEGQESKLPIKKLWADRGMFSQSNEALLEAHGMQSGLCPRNPAELKERLSDPAQREGMKRRGNTEARVAICKDVMLGNPVRSKSIKPAHKPQAGPF